MSYPWRGGTQEWYRVHMHTPTHSTPNSHQGPYSVNTLGERGAEVLCIVSWHGKMQNWRGNKRCSEVENDSTLLLLFGSETINGLNYSFR